MSSLSFTKVVLNSNKEAYPNDNSLLVAENTSILLISNVKSSNGANGHLMLIGSDGKVEAYQISEQLQISIPIYCIGFHFIGDNLNPGQELTFDFQQFV